jgi:hypothetical protein
MGLLDFHGAYNILFAVLLKNSGFYALAYVKPVAYTMNMLTHAQQGYEVLAMPSKHILLYQFIYL